ncbi:MAG: hypothetical protein JWM11_4655 [Planctomycetaceae bacterium]|nr:hypothetical protein [Planctomycetaceae bacterium]
MFTVVTPLLRVIRSKVLPEVQNLYLGIVDTFVQ